MTGATARIQPRRALRAIRNLMQDPERTDQVFAIIDARSPHESRKSGRKKGPGWRARFMMNWAAR